MNPSFNAARANVIFGIALFLGLALLCGFFAALLGSKTAGEVAGALGSFVGGLIGAAGAVVAVYLAISSQRKEESAKVTAAIRTEVASLTTYVLGAVKICQGIADGSQKIPSQDASYILRKIWGEPIVYAAVADRVGLLPHSNATVQFYMRLAEAKAMLESLQIKTVHAAETSAAARREMVTPEIAETIADSLVTALQLARGILGDDVDPQMSEWVRTEMIGQIDARIQSAMTSFPNAKSFQKLNEAAK
jgi:hypothetical protein